MHPFTVLVLRTTVRFLSPFPDSLPQLFLRCLLLVLTFRIVRLAFTFFRPCPLDFRLLSFLFLPFGFTVFPILSCLISHAFLLGSDIWLSVCFLSFYPVSLPQLLYR